MQALIGTVSQLWRYPVSSLAGEMLSDASIALQGMAGDRLGAFFEMDTGKIANPSIVRKWNIAPQISARQTSGGSVEISIDGERWRAHDDPRLANELTEFCGTAVEFKLYGSPHGEAVASQRYAWKPLHLISQQALAALQRLLPDSVIDARRFRPNIVVDMPGFAGPAPEYELIGQEFTIGSLRLRGLQASGRCSFTTLAQRGLPEDRAVLRALIHNFEKNFGIYCEVLEPGFIATGDGLRMADRPVQQRPIVIVGAGQAGAMTAKLLRDLGSRQPIEIFGEERHAPYERPPLSKPESGDGLIHVIRHQQFDELGIELHLNRRVVAIDRQVRMIETEDGARHPYDRLVLATGGTPRRLPMAERGHGHIHVMRTAEDAARLHPLLSEGTKVAIIGGGWLGLEIAATARQRRCGVTLFARQGRLLTRAVPAQVAEFIAARHRAEGVNFRFGELPAIRELRDGVELTRANGIEHADHLVVAIGITPNDHLARFASLDTADGIITSDSGATSDPYIFAVGDVARQGLPGEADGIRIESWHNANDRAYALARRLMTLPPEILPPPRFWSAQYDMMIQIAGLPDPRAEPIHVSDGDAPFWDFGSFAAAINRPREIRQFAERLAGKSGNGAASAELRPQQSGTREASSRIPIGKVSDFPPGPIHRITIEPVGTILIVQQDGTFFAADDRCPHAAASLSEGFVEGSRIVCPVHFAEFDLGTGQAFNAPPGCGNLQCYAVERTDDTLYLLF